jgi:RNA polymerase sigma-B factor
LAHLAEATPQEWQLIRDEVVTLHLWLADKAARRYGLRGENDDLVQVARIELVEAFDRYDPTQASYPNFAWATMTGLLRRHARDHGWFVRPPRPTQEAASTLHRAVPDLAQMLRRTPTTADLTTYLAWTPDAVRAARRAELGLQAASVERMSGDAWMPGHPSETDVVETRVLLRRATQTLTKVERDLLRMRSSRRCRNPRSPLSAGSLRCRSPGSSPV